MTYAEKIKGARYNAKLTQGQLADAAGLQRETISQIEQGRRPWPRGDTLRRICIALGVSLAIFDECIDSEPDTSNNV